MSIRVKAKREVQEEKNAATEVAKVQVVENQQQQHHVTHADRLKFYSGEEASTLQSAELRRVRELQSANDELQRQIITMRHECSQSQDPLKVINDIEYARATIAKNTGEILNILGQNDKRLAMIAELERKNINLQQQITDTMSSYGSTSELDKKANFASGFFGARATLDSNLALLQQLKAA